MKLQEIKEKTIDELKELVLESKKELFTLKTIRYEKTLSD